MYCPFVRGKLYELITVRETAKVMADARFVPIIEPIWKQMRGLQKALEAVCQAGGRAVIVVNPEHGELTDDGRKILSFLDQEFNRKDNLLVGIRLHSGVSESEAVSMCSDAKGKPIALIHAGFEHANAFADELSQFDTVRAHIFIEGECGKLYQKKFKTNGIDRILIRDGFERRRNRDHPDSEFFSDLHITFAEEGMVGYGDFLVVGNEFSESGGPAYTVAIHLTYIDPNQDQAMHVRHFLSDRQDTPKDPGGKFAEALQKLVTFVDNCSEEKVYETEAIKEFQNLHKRKHYPGLGYVKKLSMKHHIETLARFHRDNWSDHT